MTNYSGHYPLENRSHEMGRLRTQSEAMAPDAAELLRQTVLDAGWRCLDLGCGPEGIAGLLTPLVGPTGFVLGLDMNPAFLDHARARTPAANVEFRQGDVFQTGLPAASFDLVHSRFVASTAGSPPERLMEEAIRLARPGGIVALQEPDGSTLRCYPPHPAWDTLKAALLDAFAGVGADLRLAERLYFLARQSGLRDVQYRTLLLGVRSTDAIVDYLPATVESLASTVIRLGLLSETELRKTLAECRAHLRRPDTSFTMYTVAQVWGRVAGSSQGRNSFERSNNDHP